MYLDSHPDLLRPVLEERHESLRRQALLARLRREARVEASQRRRRRRAAWRERRPRIAAPPPALAD